MQKSPVTKMHEIWQPAEVSFSKPFDMRSLHRTPSWRREMAGGQKALSEAVLSTRQKVFSCPVCAESGSIPFVVIYGFHYLECRQCRHLYCSNPPEIGMVENLYTGDENSAKRSLQTQIYLDPENYETRTAHIAAPKVDFVGKYLQPTPGGRWIDIGSGAGETLVAAERAGWQPIGIESDPDECAFARARGLTVVRQFVTVDNVKTLLDGARVVSLFNVLEHLENPREMLSCIAESVEPGCLVVIEVPHHPSISSLSNCLFPGMSCRHIIPPDHLHVFSDASLRRMTAASALAPVGIWYFGQDYYDIISSAMANANIAVSSLYHDALDLTPLIQPIVDRAGLADTMLLVARKI
jgi:SAM-dependent methyltransferase